MKILRRFVINQVVNYHKSILIYTDFACRLKTLKMSPWDSSIKSHGYTSLEKKKKTNTNKFHFLECEELISL